MPNKSDVIIGLTVPDNDSPIKGVVVKYTGNTTLTINPEIASVSTMKTGDSIQILKSPEGNKFIAFGITVATVWNHDDMDKIEVISGGTVGGTSPFEITVQLT
ncbi:hypothetical protein R3P38DRAFT_2806261 [Favolaschia claudopus]|uniref:Uncharacterized protein n=1 Tax=Favolaschia claudopus TaxID=2862362 RepID=A0AAV9ZL00_9AGAR